MGYLFCQVPCLDDIAALVALDRRSLGGLWSAEGYRREIESPNSCLLMLVDSPSASGFNANGGEKSNLSMVSMDGPRHSSDPEPDPEPPDRRELADYGDGEASEAPNVMGLGCYWAILDEAHITVLAVDPRYQRRGLGKWLLINLLADARAERPAEEDAIALTRATLEVRPSNSRALALYESFGFETLGRRHRYYADGEDALVLWQNSLKTTEFGDRLRQLSRAATDRLERQGWQIVSKKLPANRT